MKWRLVVRRLRFPTLCHVFVIFLPFYSSSCKQYKHKNAGRFYLLGSKRQPKKKRLLLLFLSATWRTTTSSIWYMLEAASVCVCVFMCLCVGHLASYVRRTSPGSHHRHKHGPPPLKSILIIMRTIWKPFNKFSFSFCRSRNAIGIEIQNHLRGRDQLLFCIRWLAISSHWQQK